MKYTQRQFELNTQFKMGRNTLSDNRTEIRFFTFSSLAMNKTENNSLINTGDKEIKENISFQYPVFTACNTQKTDKAILLLHGLNERNWNKYLVWAEYLCIETQRPVILFPIAFHMNRSPVEWSNPRALQSILNMRQTTNGPDRSLSFANVALSQRISDKPLRFYSSGRLSHFDITELTQQIKQGSHPLFKEDTHLDIFAYSIGAFLSQITLMTNPENLFSDSKLFLFCGGGVFSSMMGESRSIMDKTAYSRLYNFYIHNFDSIINSISAKDSVFDSFNQMIAPDRDKIKRELFFSSLGNRLTGISLRNDKVMPFSGIAEALGNKLADASIKQLDFPFEYCHENPFPIGVKTNATEVDRAFTSVFERAAHFFS